MPEFIVTSPEGKKFRVTAPDGTTRDEAIAYVQKNITTSATNAPKEKSFGEQVLGVAKSAGTGLARGAIGAFTVPFDIGAQLQAAASNFGMGNNPMYPKAEAPPSLTENVYNITGLNDYKPQGTVEEYARTIGEFVGGGGRKFVIPSTVAGATSETAGQATKGTEYEPVARFLGGLAPALPETVLRYGGNIVKTLAQPFTEKGRENIIGQALKEASQDVNNVLPKLKNAQDIVPGSQPTAGEVSQDFGLISLEKATKGKPENKIRFEERLSQQNKARNVLLDSMAKTKSSKELLEQERDAITGLIRENAFNQAIPLEKGFFEKPIKDALSKPSAKRESVEKALLWVQSRIGDEVRPRAIYEIRKDINDAMQGKYSGELSNLRLAKSELKEIKNALDDALEKSAPGFKNYIDEYAKRSVPINQLEVLQDIQGRVMLAAPDPKTGYDFISPAKFSNIVKNADTRKELERVLSKEQLSNLDKISADLDRGTALNNPIVRPVGSNTYENFTLSSLLGAVLGRGLSEAQFPKTVGRSINWIYKMPEEQMNQLLVDAMLDPKLAYQLMQKAKPTNIDSFVKSLQQRAKKYGFVSAVGTTAGQVDKGENKPTLNIDIYKGPTNDRSK